MKRVFVVVAVMALLFVISIHSPAFCGTVKYYPDMPGGKMSADGRYVVFQSDASDLVPNDTNNATDVFVRDLTTGTTTRVSVSSAGEQASGSEPAISANGRFVAFASGSNNLVSGDTNLQGDIFVHDMVTGETTMVSISSNGDLSNGSSHKPSISPDGRYVTFWSYATNLIPNGPVSEYLHDRKTGETKKVFGSETGGFGFSEIDSAGNQYMVCSNPDSVSSDDNNDVDDIFITNLVTGEIELISVAYDGGPAIGGSSYSPSISADGRYVAFQSRATNLVADDTNSSDIGDIFVRDRKTGKTVIASINPAGEQAADGYNGYPAISADGRFVSFTSRASNFVNGPDGLWYIFIYDQALGKTSRLPLPITGDLAIDGKSRGQSISADGRYVAFQSQSTYLVPEHNNNQEFGFFICDTGFKGAGSIVEWGYNYYGNYNIPTGDDYIAVDSGAKRTAALKSDGSLAAWGYNSNSYTYEVPSGNDFTAISVNDNFGVFLKSDGSLVDWGGYLSDIPTDNGYTAVTEGVQNGLAIKSDGSLVAWGYNYHGEHGVPSGNNFVAIAGGDVFFVAVKSDGSLVAWGYNDFGQCNVPVGNNFVAVTACGDYGVALKSDGSLAAWGVNSDGQCDVPTGNDYVAVSAGRRHCLALKSDGSIVAWGSNLYGQCDVPAGNNFTAIAATETRSAAIVAVPLAPMVTSVAPNNAYNDGAVNVTVFGDNFAPEAAVALVRAGQSDITVSGTTVFNSSQITCTMDLTGRALGNWDVVVTNPDMQSGALKDGFTVNAPGTTPPTVTINQASDQADPTQDSPVNFTVEFSEPVTDFAAGDVIISGTSGGAKTASVTGSGTTYNVAVNGMTTSGTVIASLVAGVAHDSAGDPSAASTSTDNSVMFENISPTVTINQDIGQRDPSYSSLIFFTVVFSEPVTDFASDDVTISGTAGGNKTITVTGSGTTYNVTISGMTNGTVIADLAAGIAHDSDGNPSMASTSIDNSVTYDNTELTVTINQAAGQEDPTSGSPINFTIVFSRPVLDFIGSPDHVQISGTAGGTKTVAITGSGTTYNIAVSGMTTNGTVIASLVHAAGRDTPRNGSSLPTSTDNTVTYDDTAPDNTSPAVTINQATSQADPTSDSPINFTVEFTEPVTDFATGDVTITGTSEGLKTATVTGSGTIYDVAVSGMTSTGTVIATLAAEVAHDASGNPSIASTSTNNLVTYEYIGPDTKSPTVTINQATGQEDPTSDSPINFTVVFSEPVTDFEIGDVTITGSAEGSKVATVTGSGTTYNVSVRGMTDGTVIASLAAGVAHDAAGNPSLASTSTDNIVTYDTTDRTSPTVTINQASGQEDPTSDSPINFTVEFSETVTDFSTGDVTITGTAGGSKTATVTGSGTTYNVAVSGMVSSDTVITSLAAGVAHDAAGNPSLASTSTDNKVSFDNTDRTPPEVTINQAASQTDPTSDSSINFTVEFTEPVTDFITSDVTITGTAGGTKTATVTGSGTTYNVAVNGMTTSGTVIASLAAGVAHDAAGNPNTASTSTDNTVTYNWTDTVSPTVTINQKSGQSDPTNTVSISFTVVFSESVTDFSTGDVTITGTAGGSKTAKVTGSGTTYNVEVSGMTSSGTVVASVSAGVAHDAAGNPCMVSTSTDNTVLFDISTPLIALVFPTEETVFTRNGTELTLSGTAKDDLSGVTEVTCSINGSSAILCNGTTAWEVSGLTLNSGANTITLRATDIAGNTGSLNLSVDVIDFSPETAWNGLAMVSLPIIPDLIDPKPVVGFMNNSWTSWNPATGQYTQYNGSQNESWFVPRESTPGRGFWARFNSGVFSPVGLVPLQENPVKIHLNAGWNLIGTPFVSSVVWNLDGILVEVDGETKSLANAADIVNGWCWGWNSANNEYYLVYDKNIIPGVHGAIDPWLGYWIKAYVDCDLTIPEP